MTPRRLFAAIFTILLLSSCATTGVYTWYRAAPSLTHRVWVQRSQADFELVCRWPVPGERGACARRLDDFNLCVIFSPYSEVEAAWVKDVDGAPLIPHEHRHCDGEFHTPDYPPQR